MNWTTNPIHKDKTKTKARARQEGVERVGNGIGAVPGDRGSVQDSIETENDDFDQEYLDEKQLARRLRVSPRTLQAWRASGSQDLAYCKFGRRVLYPMSAIIAYEKARLRKSTSEY